MLNKLLPPAKGPETILGHGANLAGFGPGPGREQLMRIVVLVPCFLLLAIAARADDDLTVLKPGPDGASPRSMLSKYLNGEAGKAFEARRAAVSALKTPDDLARRQREL